MTLIFRHYFSFDIITPLIIAIIDSHCFDIIFAAAAPYFDYDISPLFHFHAIDAAISLFY
jgi:hypothetical protein